LANVTGQSVFAPEIIMTDGECSKPTSSRVKRAWIIVPGEKLLFETDELVVQMDDSKDAAEGR
jgi:hypothetical protein